MREVADYQKCAIDYGVNSAGALKAGRWPGAAATRAQHDELAVVIDCSVTGGDLRWSTFLRLQAQDNHRHERERRVVGCRLDGT
jgi:hypothetical protein